MDILRKTFGINRTVVHHGKTAAGNDVKSQSYNVGAVARYNGLCFRRNRGPGD
jgi:hypothetical protein